MTMFDPMRAGYAPVHDEDPMIARAWERLARRELDLLVSDDSRPSQERRQALKSMRQSVLNRLAKRADADLKQFVHQIDGAIASLAPKSADPISRGFRSLRALLDSSGRPGDPQQS